MERTAQVFCPPAGCAIPLGAQTAAKRPSWRHVLQTSFKTQQPAQQRMATAAVQPQQAAAAAAVAEAALAPLWAGWWEGWQPLPPSWRCFWCGGAGGGGGGESVHCPCLRQR